MNDSLTVIALTVLIFVSISPFAIILSCFIFVGAIIGWMGSYRRKYSSLPCMELCRKCGLRIALIVFGGMFVATLIFSVIGAMRFVALKA